MNREELVSKLQLVTPALSDTDLVPVLQHFWFKEETLTCYNDQIAIQTPLKSNFTGAIPSTLIQLLSASKAKDVEIDYKEDGTLVVKAASSRFKLPYLTAKSFEIFTMPEPDPKKALPIAIDGFLEVLELCMRSLKEDTSMPDSMGITLDIHDGKVYLYATNDATISTSVVKLKSDVKDCRVVISGNFCRQMVSLSKLEGVKHLEIYKDYSLFSVGSTVLFGRLVDVTRPLDFEAVIESSFPASADDSLVAVPSKLELILDRAIIITDSKQDRPKTSIVVKGGIAKFFSQSVDRGEVHDSCQLEQQHPEVSMNIDPRLFKAGYGAYSKMLLTEQCLVMVEGSSLYLVSASH